MTMTDPNDLLMGGGAKTFKFAEIGDTVEGEIADVVTAQSTTIDGEPETWADGSPKMQIVLTVKTGLNESDDDDGLRKVYVKGNLFAELRNAVKASGARLAVGGGFKARYDSDGEPPKRGYSPPKLFKVKYTPPAPRAVDLDDF